VVTTDVLFEIFRDLATRFRVGASGLAFTHETNKVKDEDSSLSYPLCVWYLPATTTVDFAEVTADTVTLRMEFIDQTDKDRTAIEMMRKHSAMNVAGRIIWKKFYKDYLVNEGEWDGYPVDLSRFGPAVFTPIWDEGTMMRTGVALEVTIRVDGPVECVDTYFA